MTMASTLAYHSSSKRNPYYFYPQNGYIYKPSHYMNPIVKNIVLFL